MKNKIGMALLIAGVIALWSYVAYSETERKIRERDHQISTEVKLDRLLEIAEEFE